jgi:hypothetical protein
VTGEAGEPEPWGQVAYEGYIGDITDTEAFVHDRLLMPWEQLTQLEKAHWEAAGQAVLAQQRRVQ